MSVGLELVNDLGEKQLIDKAPLLVFKDTVYTQSSAYGYRQFTANNLLVIKPNSVTGVTTLFNRFARASISIPDDDNAKIAFSLVGDSTVYRFGFNLPVESNENYGLEVFDEDGLLQFTSAQKPLKILDIVTSSDVRALNSNTTVNSVFWSKSYPGKDVGVIISKSGLWSFSPYFMSVGSRKIGDTLELVSARVHKDREGVEYGGGIVKTYFLSAFIIDLTGY